MLACVAQRRNRTSFSLCGRHHCVQIVVLLHLYGKLANFPSDAWRTILAGYSIFVTDLTNYGERRCIAGWDIEKKRMIRPEPFAGGFWPQANDFRRKRIVSFNASRPNPPTTYPHFTEDRVVSSAVSVINSCSKEEQWSYLDECCSESLEDLFDGNLVYDWSKGYVPEGTDCASLGGIELPAGGAYVEEYTNYGGKQRLRIHFADGGHNLAPNLTSTRAHEVFASEGLGVLNERVSKAKRIHLRIGLARAFDRQPDRCYPPSQKQVT